MNLNNDIISFLFAEGKVNLPGLGILLLTKNSAYRSVSKTKIHAPKYTITFLDNEFDENINNLFIKYVEKKYSKNHKTAENITRKFSLSLLNNLANFNNAPIDNLGTFSRVDEKLNFEFSPVFKEILQNSYPDLPLLYFSRENEIKSKGKQKATVPSVSNNRLHKRNKKDKNNWVLPLILLTLASLAFVCLMYCISNVLDNDDVKPSDIGNKVKSSATISTSSDSNYKNSNISQKLVKNDSIISSSNKPGNNTKTNNEPEAISINETKDINEEKQLKSATNNDFSNETEELEKINLTEMLNFGPELINQYNKSCIIIVGSFVRKSNASKMLQKLYSSGFTPYVEKNGKFHRTGVIFDCNDKPLLQFLEELRQSVDKESWVLKYK